jgi:hypothetical protein
VEIDEFHCFTPKYNKGRTPAKVAVWGFGRIDVNTRDVFVVPVEKRTKYLLLLLFRKYISPVPPSILTCGGVARAWIVT